MITDDGARLHEVESLTAEYRGCADETIARRRWPREVGDEVAPEIEGKDADGDAFKLSDYRGKVVVMTFSGNWCGPCRAMYPDERVSPLASPAGQDSRSHD